MITQFHDVPLLPRTPISRPRRSDFNFPSGLQIPAHDHPARGQSSIFFELPPLGADVFTDALLSFSLHFVEKSPVMSIYPGKVVACRPLPAYSFASRPNRCAPFPSPTRHKDRPIFSPRVSFPPLPPESPPEKYSPPNFGVSISFEPENMDGFTIVLFFQLFPCHVDSPRVSVSSPPQMFVSFGVFLFPTSHGSSVRAGRLPLFLLPFFSHNVPYLALLVPLFPVRDLCCFRSLDPL